MPCRVIATAAVGLLLIGCKPDPCPVSEDMVEADRAKVVVIDVTGVLAIDSQVSHHLIQMIRAIGLMGAEAILTGIRPEIARALTNLNIDLGDVITRSSLSEGLKEAFRRLNIEAVNKPRPVPAS